MVDATTPTAPEDFDPLSMLLDQNALREPQPHYDLLHATAPVVRTQGGFYLVSRYDDTSRVLKDNALFRSPGTEAINAADPRFASHPALNMVSRSILALDGKDHTHLRKLSAREFMPRRVFDIQPTIERICTKHVDSIRIRLCDGETVDVMEELAVPFPLELIAEMIGIPSSDRPYLATVVRALLKLIEPDPTIEVVSAADHAFLELEEYLLRHIRDRRARPQDDLTSALIATAEASSESYSDDQIVLSLIVVWAAGFDTSAAAIGNGIVTLLGSPNETDAMLAGGQNESRRFVDEILRLECPVQIPPAFRYATADIEFGEVTIPAGSDVRVLLSAANRDRAVYDNPDVFCPERLGRPALTFSAGIHYCLGAGLAKAELTTILRQYALHLRHAVLVKEPDRRTSLLFRTYGEVNIALE
ncbi:cytochrome P450 [Streptomyces sp. NPDC058469]|uniref:cytochrome P450 n=1 Tax=Streptomyces sp. NPDC058469 TaxID=3346514 RepID=UPI003653A3CA